MPVLSTVEWRQLMDQSRYDYALPWERFAINFWRWRAGKPLLRPTPRRLRRA